VSGEPPVGFIRIIELDGLVHLEQLSVLPEHGRKGIGSQLIEAAVAELKARGYSRLTLITFKNVPQQMNPLPEQLVRLRKREKALLRMDALGERVVMYREL
jgi:GNAT superfamily N-acetyltransferase